MRSCCQNQTGICNRYKTALARKSELHGDHTWKHAPGSWLPVQLTRGWCFKAWLLIYKSWNGWRGGISPCHPAATLTNKGMWASAAYDRHVWLWQVFPREQQGKLSLVLSFFSLKQSTSAILKKKFIFQSFVCATDSLTAVTFFFVFLQVLITNS